MTDTRWIDRTEYPFRSRYFETDAGRMHYVDEGRGEPVVLVHGTPTWSFLYRHLIRDLSGRYRVIAVDHLGFGLSDKPADAPYRPQDHARRLELFLRHLGLEAMTLAVHDFGGPIGLSYAVEHPEQVKRLVLFNTWMWSVADDPSARRASRVMGGPIGRLLYQWLNFSPRVLIPAVVGDRAKLSREAHQHYIRAFPHRRDRMAPWVLARELVGSSGWYEELWKRRDRIRDKPALLLWGMRDPTFTPEFLERWMGVLRDGRAVRLPDAGHFVPEEAGDAALEELEPFLAGS